MTIRELLNNILNIADLDQEVVVDYNGELLDITGVSIDPGTGDMGVMCITVTPTPTSSVTPIYGDYREGYGAK